MARTAYKLVEGTTMPEARKNSHNEKIANAILDIGMTDDGEMHQFTVDELAKHLESCRADENHTLHGTDPVPIGSTRDYVFKLRKREVLVAIPLPAAERSTKVRKPDLTVDVAVNYLAGENGASLTDVAMLLATVARRVEDDKARKVADRLVQRLHDENDAAAEGAE